MANNTTESIYAVLGADPERAGRFGHAMMVYGSKPEHSPAFITDHYDWASLGQAKVVHVGGGPGHIATALATRHANLSLVVQDQEFMMGLKEAGLPELVLPTSSGSSRFSNSFRMVCLVNPSMVLFAVSRLTVKQRGQGSSHLPTS